MAQLLVLASHYLSLRLPAEVILPHRDHPIPTIRTPSASYLSRDTTTSLSTHTATTSRAAGFLSNHHRPRPLVVRKELPKLAREEPGEYALFLEGATLLAWDVSWLCWTQGLSVASDSWEDVCDLGKNLWSLLVAPPVQESASMRTPAGRDSRSRARSSRDNHKSNAQRSKTVPTLGHYSHGTVHSFLGAAEGTEFIRTWKLPPPTKVMDKLRTNLLGEMASAEWEFLDKKEWDDEARESRIIVPNTSATAEPAIQAGLQIEGREFHPAGAKQTRNEQNIIDDESNTNRPRGINGWTKLKSRERDV